MTIRWQWVLICGLLHTPLGAADVQVVWGTAYDSNLYEAASRTQGGLVSRFFMTATAQPFLGQQAAVKLVQQAGVKRLWEQADGQPEAGDVLVYHLDAQIQRRLGGRSMLLGGGQVKFKQATRTPGEESYLRGGVFVQLSTRLWPRVVAGGTFRAGADDSRDPVLPEVDHTEWGTEVRYAHNRRLTGRLSLNWRWLHYGREALDRPIDEGLVPLGQRQKDRLQTAGIEVQVYHGMLIQAAYAFLNNHSNSFGYGYRAHRVQGMVVRHLGQGVDAQVFGQFQFRKYDDVLPVALGQVSEADEYEQTMGILKLSRQLNAQYGISVQYAFYRNGARQGDAFYRKHVYSVAFEAKM